MGDGEKTKKGFKRMKDGFSSKAAFMTPSCSCNSAVIIRATSFPLQQLSEMPLQLLASGLFASEICVQHQGDEEEAFSSK